MTYLPWNADAARQLLAVARSYYHNRSRLIYAFRGRTFLGGWDLCDEDYDHRGNIDCSTYVQLVLQGIPYKCSPYVTGQMTLRPPADCCFRQEKLFALLSESPDNRRAHAIARCYAQDGRCFEDAGLAKPGDLVFYRSPEEFVPYYREHGFYREICHVGIVAEDGASMYNAVGLPDKKEQVAMEMDAIQITPLVADRSPLLFARPFYKNAT